MIQIANKLNRQQKEQGHFKIIDKVTVKLNERRDVYEAQLANLGVKGIEISSTYVKQFEKLLVGGIWCVLTLQYYYEEGGKTSPFLLVDSAFFDRMHAYLPGWEIPKMKPEFLTSRYGLIVDFLAEYFREMRKRNFADALESCFKLGNNLNQRDVILLNTGKRSLCIF